MTEHTPGPWHAVLVKGGTVAYINGHETSTLTTLKAPFRNADRMNADARLIAAAPDLLAICVDLLTIGGDILGSAHMALTDYHELDALLDRAYAVVRKAEGKQP